jgi:hypothetical protein
MLKKIIILLLVDELSNPGDPEKIPDNYAENFVYITRMPGIVPLFISNPGLPEEKYLKRLMIQPTIRKTISKTAPDLVPEFQSRLNSVHSEKLYNCEMQFKFPCVNME